MRAHAQAQPSADGLRTASRGVQAWTLAICFLIVLLDGLDTTSIAFGAPVLGREWGLAGAAFTAAFIPTSVGAVIGYMAGGPLAERFGQRLIGLVSVALFGVGTVLTATATDVATLSLMRLVSAIGLGGALPIAIAAAAGVVPARHRVTAAMLAATGFSAGAVIGGLAGGPLMSNVGWPSVFIVGGAIPLLVLPAFAAVMSAHAEPARPIKANPIAALFRDRLGVRSGLLWLFAFLVFLVAYALGFWIPTLLTEVGFTPDQAPLGAAALGMGGLVGSIVMVAIVGRLGVERVLVPASLLAIACITMLSRAIVSPGLVLVLIAGTGAGLLSGSVGQSALAVSLYPAELRATGVGWAAALGRLGSIVGPAAGGAMLSFGWPARDIVLIAVLPTGVAILTLGAMLLVRSRGLPLHRDGQVPELGLQSRDDGRVRGGPAGTSGSPPVDISPVSELRP
jgi:MFS transporter, AAHS family, 4-hydroxybenzoate transporter